MRTLKYAHISHAACTLPFSHLTNFALSLSTPVRQNAPMPPSPSPLPKHVHRLRSGTRLVRQQTHTKADSVCGGPPRNQVFSAVLAHMNAPNRTHKSATQSPSFRTIPERGGRQVVGAARKENQSATVASYRNFNTAYVCNRVCVALCLRKRFRVIIRLHASRFWVAEGNGRGRSCAETLRLCRILTLSLSHSQSFWYTEP